MEKGLAIGSPLAALLAEREGRGSEGEFEISFSLERGKEAAGRLSSSAAPVDVGMRVTQHQRRREEMRRRKYKM